MFFAGDPDSVAGEFGRHSLYKMLGYFSLVGLLRLHSLLGDYYQALKVLENIDFSKIVSPYTFCCFSCCWKCVSLVIHVVKYLLNIATTILFGSTLRGDEQKIVCLNLVFLFKQTMSSRVPACQISTFYYVGFAYMMMRRYQDAIRTFSNILLYIQRTKQMFQNKTYLYDQVIFSNSKCRKINSFIHSAVGRKTRNTCFSDRSINKMNKCTPCWQCVWSSIRWGLMRVFILNSGKSLEIVCYECKRGKFIYDVFLFDAYLLILSTFSWIEYFQGYGWVWDQFLLRVSQVPVACCTKLWYTGKQHSQGTHFLLSYFAGDTGWNVVIPFI